MKRMLRTMVPLCGLLAVAAIAQSGEAPKPATPARDAANYVGMKPCGMCHRAEASGNQLAAWQASPHAKAFELLGTPEAKAAGAKLGVTDPQASPKCLKCHSTAYNFGETVATDKITPAEGVTCESCHGPGKGYMAKAVMVDRAKAIAGGLVYPAKQSCVMCHNDKNPGWKPDRYTLKDGKKVGFDFDQAWEKIKHADPKVAH